MALSMDQLVGLWGPCVGDSQPPATATIERVCTDSRGDLKGALFVPLVGERFDGHTFLETALAEGGAMAAVARWDRVSNATAAALAARTARPLWRVEDTLDAYQDLGRLWRRSLAAPVVAVTGSAGKTTTRELIAGALSPLGPVLASSGNENNDVGVPLTLLKADGATAALVVEMGMRGLGEIERLCRCAEPDVAVITNIGTAHIGRLGSREAIARAKCEITTALRADGLMVIPAGDPLLEATLAKVWTGRVCRVALADEISSCPSHCPPADLVGRLDPVGEGEPEGKGAPLLLERACLPGEPIGGRPPACWEGRLFRVPLAGRHNARNLLLGLAVAAELGVEAEAIESLAVAVPGGRNSRREIHGVRVLDETYNASPEAVLAALDLLAAQPGRRFAVLGTMLELGDLSLVLHASVARRAVELGLDGLVIVDAGAEGEAMAAAARGLGRLVHVDTPAAAASPLLEWLRPGDHLLLKASRGVALEQLMPLLEEGLAGG